MNILLAASDKLFGDALVRFCAKHIWESSPQFKLINIVAPLQQHYGSSDAEKKAYFDKEMQLADKMLSQLKTALLKSLPEAYITYDVLVGSPAHEILEYAKSWPADLIVMGSSSKNGLERLLLGSVSHYVASHAQCSFCIIRIEKKDILVFESSQEELL
ncbi:MAG TPA: universal stress protein [Candidatus Melainabacteria bacterium]|nr:universal stress protein [Candidatus Melainabacteria bacterium]HIN63107.1 universal stress protein [Candidatus Obscuribacterales bacterium]